MHERNVNLKKEGADPKTSFALRMLHQKENNRSLFPTHQSSFLNGEIDSSEFMARSSKHYQMQLHKVTNNDNNDSEE